MTARFVAQRGFTLIELMIVVSVIAVLASIGYPSYTEYVAKSRRTAMTASLQQGQQWMERFYTENFSYYQVRGSNALSGELFPAALKQSPVPGEGSAQYNIAVTVDTKQPEAFTLRASRTGGMTSDRCGDYSLDQYGRKKIENYDVNKFSTMQQAIAYCWK